jgi:hydroxyacylglutathione hydrolase
MLTVLHVPAFEDNYIWLIRASGSDRVAVVDPGDAAPVRETLARLRLTPAAILCTHHHGDHVGGVAELAASYKVPVYGPARERIPAVTHRLQDGEHIALDGLGFEFDVLDVPGHTAGHIAYYGHGGLFCGDTLFSAGCGRLFEGTADQLHRSLGRLASLPPDTAVYCAHEYTAANLRFALAVEPGNSRAHHYQEQVRAQRARQSPTLPSALALEREVNPFLRVHLPQVRKAVTTWAGHEPKNKVETFALLRRWKDRF